MPDLRVCSVDDVAPDSSKRFDPPGYRLVVVRIGDDAWYCLDDRCSHAEASLASGDVWPEDREIECPLHSSVFDLETGKALTLPATAPQATYAVRVDGDDVIVEVPR
ncbi:MAG TPA: non-heme iron oxygenase ferredoxin subunit [Acidimicrobiia bacterium]|nr:non-heme iron oxygenase ferredoxin subunit [Acidimicrobiia bacterium]